MDRERLVIAALATGVAALVVRAHSRRRSDSAQPTTSHTRRKHENIACPPRAHLVLTKEQTERLRLLCERLLVEQQARQAGTAGQQVSEPNK